MSKPTCRSSGLIEPRVFGQSQRDRAAEAVEDQSVGDRVQHAATERAETREGLERVAGDG